MKLRTIRAAYQEIKRLDPDTSLTEFTIRDLVVRGRIPSVRQGVKYLVDLDAVETYFREGMNTSVEEYHRMLAENWEVI